MLKKDIEKRVRQLWRENRPINPTDSDMSIFYTKLRKEHYELTVWCRMSDPWQSIHCWLIDEERKIKRLKNKSQKLT